MFSPIPFGSGSAMSGMDFSPWLEGRRQNLQQIIAESNLAAQVQSEAAQLAQRAEEQRQLGMRADAELAAMTRNQDLNREQGRYGIDQDVGLKRSEIEQRDRLSDAELGVKRESIQAGRDEGEADRAFREKLSDKEIAQSDKRAAEQGERFDKELAQKGAELDFRKSVAFKQLANEDARLEIDQKMAELDTALKTGQIDNQRYQSEHLRIGVEAAGRALAEAKADVGLTPAQWNTVIGFFEQGQVPPGEIMAVISKSPKAAAALDFFYKAIDSARQGAGDKAKIAGLAAETELTKSKTEGQNLENEIVRAKTKPILGKSGELGEAEQAAKRDLDRKFADGNLGEIGELRQGAYEKLSEIQGDTSEPAIKRREKLERLLKLTEGMEDEDDIPGSLSPDKYDTLLGLSIVGIPALVGRTGYRIANRIRQEMGMGEEGELRGLADEFDVEP
jgi:hypothetical protein